MTDCEKCGNEIEHIGTTLAIHNAMFGHIYLFLCYNCCEELWRYLKSIDKKALTWERFHGKNNRENKTKQSND